MSCTKAIALPPFLSPNVYEMISFESASIAVHAQVSPYPCASLSGVGFFAFAPINAQISSHWTRRTRRF
jgi:hypothetical protein